MKKFTNKNILKEQKLMIRRIIVFILVIAVSIGFKYWQMKVIEDTNKNITDLDSIIVNEEEKTDKKAYIDINMIPYQFAVSDDIESSYYMVSDANNLLYVVYMKPSDFEKLNNEEIKNTPVRIEGITKTTSDEIKELAVKAYNVGLEEEYQISLNEFNQYFGSVYLDMTAKQNGDASILFMFFLLSLLFGGIGLLVSLVNLIKYNKKISKMSSEEIEELDNEMNDENAFYYEKIHLYLTNKYVINFNGSFMAVKYDDIIWMYPFEQRTNGIKTSQAIKVMTEDGKTYTIATIDVVSKTKKEIYNEIWNTIVSKNNKMLLGYTKENINEIKERKKNKTDM